MKLNKVLQLIIMLLALLLSDSSSFAQEAKTNKPVWSEDQWKEAKQGIDYTDEDKKEKDKQETQDKSAESEEGDDSSSGFNATDWLNDFFSSPIIKIITIFFIVILLIVTIYFLMKSNGKKDNKVTSLLISDLDNANDNIEETDLDRFLRLSLEAGDYNSAIRILYLTTLQSLHIGKFLIWQKDKTNQDYLSEMKKQQYYGDFRELTYIYELVWYGDQPISAEEFNQLKYLFDKFIETLRIGKH